MSANNTQTLAFDPTNKDLKELLSALQVEKKKFQTKLSDSKINLNNNKENLISIILSSNFLNSEYNNAFINDLISENKTLLEKLSNAYKTKILKEKELNHIVINLDSRFKWEREKVSASNNEIYYMNTKLKEKDHIIENLKCEIDKYINLDLEFTKEVYLTDPKKNNIDIVNEMAYTKDIIKKISVIYESEKKSRDKMDADLNLLQKDYETVNRNKTGLSTYDNSKKDFKFTSTNIQLQIANRTFGKTKQDFNSTGNLNFSELHSLHNKQIEDISNLNNLNAQQNQNESKMSNDSEAESDLNLNSDEPEKQEEIQNIKFPDKVIMKQSTLNKRNSDMPRLDMTRVYQKYQSQSNLHIIKPIKKASHSQSKIGLGHSKKLLKYSTASIKANQVNNVKNEINQTRETIKNLENSLEEIKKISKENKNKHLKIKENLKIADSKIENLKNQIKLYTNKEINDELISDSDSSDDFDISQDNSFISINKNIEEEKL